jgi:hypothetical protein
MRRFPWEILLALAVGIGLGLVYAWMISPRDVTNADPSTLRADFKDQYRSAIAAAYAASENLPRARVRLQLLKDANPVEALNAQAQQMLARGNSSMAADQVAALAQALVEGEGKEVPTSSPAPPVAQGVAKTPKLPSTTPPALELTFVETETPLATPAEETQPALPSSTPRPTRTLVPTQGAPFKLTGQDEVCDPNLPDGLLQVIVLSSSRRQLPGMEIDITWDSGEEKFFTGLKPDQGNGYADFIMTPDVSYSLQLATGSDIAAGLVAPTCQNPAGENYSGSLKLTFQQP